MLACNFGILILIGIRKRITGNVNTTRILYNVIVSADSRTKFNFFSAFNGKRSRCFIEITVSAKIHAGIIQGFNGEGIISICHSVRNIAGNRLLNFQFGRFIIGIRQVNGSCSYSIYNCLFRVGDINRITTDKGRCRFLGNSICSVRQTFYSNILTIRNSNTGLCGTHISSVNIIVIVAGILYIISEQFSGSCGSNCCSYSVFITGDCFT